ncbi:MAG: TetR/AcrR family transcriptional regulator [Spirochaetales bacterium]|nr:TetR/AcrR family transcriptional regulator [Spirochaetales bacterium]
MKNTKKEILNVAEKLILSKGYNGFSYNDISAEIGIKKASIHYHFATKPELASAVVKRYLRLFKFWCLIKEPLSSKEKIRAFGMMYKDLSDNCHKICPVSMLSAEYPTLAIHLKNDIKKLISEVENWLSRVLEQGINDDIFRKDLSPTIISKIIYCSLSNAISMYRIFGNLPEIELMTEQILNMIC